MNRGQSKHSKKSSKILINSASIEKKGKNKLNNDVITISHKKVRPHKSIIDKNAIRAIDEPTCFTKFEGFLENCYKRFFNFFDKFNNNFSAIAIILSLLTIFVIFTSQARILSGREHDEGFSDMNLACIIIFSLETIILCYKNKLYLLSFFFYFDLLTILSLIPDLIWIREQILKDLSVSGKFLFFVFYNSVCLLRIVKLYKYFYEMLSKIQMLSDTQKKLNSDITNISNMSLERDHVDSHGENVEMDNMGHDPRIKHNLTYKLNKKVILMILSIMITVPLFLAISFIKMKSSFELGVKFMVEWGYDSPKESNACSLFTKTKDHFFKYHQMDDYKIIELSANSTSQCITQKNLYEARHELLRAEEILTIDVCSRTDPLKCMKLLLNIKEDYVILCTIEIIKTIIILSVFIISTFLYENDIMNYVITPIENMYFKINSIAKNPLEATEDYIEEYDQNKDEKNDKKNNQIKNLRKNYDIGQYETTVLSKTISKIGSLLAMSFGEAGAEVIRKNMSVGGDIDPMVQGKKTFAIFGFCDIKNFSFIDEALQENIMIFINQVCEIIHTTISFFHGIVIKNREGSFILAWRFPEEILCFEGVDEIKIKDIGTLNQIADLSIVAVIKLCIELKKSMKLKTFIENHEIKHLFPKGYVEMIFALHAGWAIEGALGSDFKIDPSFLSPNVNIAAKMLNYTSLYHTDILISEKLFTLFSRNAKEKLRNIDRVWISGNYEAMRIYTSDVNLEPIQTNAFYAEPTKKEKREKFIRAMIKRRERFKKIVAKEMELFNLFTVDNDLKMVSSKNKKEFYTAFSRAMNFYINGEWDTAKNIFEKTLSLTPNKYDGPTFALLDYMNKFNFIAPKKWDGYRDI